MTPWKENLLLILFVAGMAVSLFNTCNQVKDSTHTEKEFQAVRDSLKQALHRTDSIVTVVQTIGLQLDSIHTHRTITIPKKYAPQKAAVVAAPNDSLADIIRSGLREVQ